MNSSTFSEIIYKFEKCLFKLILFPHLTIIIEVYNIIGSTFVYHLNVKYFITIFMFLGIQNSTLNVECYEPNFSLKDFI